VQLRRRENGVVGQPHPHAGRDHQIQSQNSGLKFQAQLTAIKPDIDEDSDLSPVFRKKIRATTVAFTMKVPQRGIARIAILA
jgi:hypothetical protein